MSRIVLHIDRLVLRGIDPHDAEALSRAVQTELQRLFAEPGSATALAASGNRARVSSADVRLPAGGNDRALGRAIATGVDRGLRP
nr:hypothetical protein [uncultured Pseudomonas sp.]